MEGRFTTELYADTLPAEDVAAGLQPRRPAWAIAPDSVIVSPELDAVLEVGRPVVIRGRAWSFRGIAAVEVSTDGGARFTRADLAPRAGWGWQAFSLVWRPAGRGEVKIAARAIEAGGAAQPAEGARNAMHRVGVVVR